MDTTGNPYQSSSFHALGLIAADAEVSERTAFIRRTYLHLGGAVLAFTAIEAALLSTPGVAETMLGMLGGGRWNLALFMLAFMGVAWIANAWAQSEASPKLQYLGLSLYVVAEAVMFVPLLAFAEQRSENIIPEAGLITLIIFGGLTAIAMLSKTDFSFLGAGLSIAGFAAVAVAIGGAIFGFNLGLLFTGCMLALASGYILYDTSNVIHRYRIGQHVAASLALFASLALLFWYVVRLVMAINSRD